MRFGAPADAARHSSRLAVEDPEGVGIQPPAVLGTELLAAFVQIGVEELEVARAAHAVAHRVDPEVERGQPEGTEEPVGQGDDLDVEVGIG